MLICDLLLQAEMRFHDLSAMWKDGGVLSTDNQCQPRGAVNKPVIPPISFEVSRDLRFYADLYYWTQYLPDFQKMPQFTSWHAASLCLV